jgi:hypothetical protein
MRHIIYPEATVSVVASSEDANYPATNLTDNDYRKKVWKAASGVNVATLPCSISGTSEVITLHNTNAVTAACTVRDGSSVIISDVTHDLNTATQRYENFWQEYTEQAAAHTATIVLTAAAGETVEAGIVKAGDMLTLVNPPDVSKKPVTFSTKKQLRNGALYTKAGEVIRHISYTMLMTHAKAEDLYDFFKTIDPEPFAFLIADSIGDDNLWCFFGAFDGEPDISYDYPTHARATISLLEAV